MILEISHNLKKKKKVIKFFLKRPEEGKKVTKKENRQIKKNFIQFYKSINLKLFLFYHSSKVEFKSCFRKYFHRS